MKKNVLKKVAGTFVLVALLGAFVSCGREPKNSGKSDPIGIDDPADDDPADDDPADDDPADDDETGTALKAAAGWWINMLDADIKVDSGKSLVMKFKVDEITGVKNWSTPDIYLIALNDAGWIADEAIVRTDNYGWGDGYATATLASNWDWDNFLSIIEGSTYTVTIKNYGATADVLMSVKGSNGNDYYQNYTGITIANPDNVYVRLSGDEGAWSGTLYSTNIVTISE